MSNSLVELKDLVNKASLENKKEDKDKTSVIDKSFYTSSMSFSKEDFEGFEELEKSVKKNSIITTIMIVLLIIFIVATLVVMANYVFDLGLFK